MKFFRLNFLMKKLSGPHLAHHLVLHLLVHPLLPILTQTLVLLPLAHLLPVHPPLVHHLAHPLLD